MKNVIKANPRSRVSKFAYDIMFRGRTIEDAVSKGINKLELLKELSRMGYYHA